MVSLMNIVVLIVTITLAQGQTWHFGSCPYQEVIPSFKYPLYLGRWYEQERYKNMFDLGGRCAIADYTHEGIGLIGLHNSYYNWYGALIYEDGIAAAEESLDVGRLVARYGTSEEPYWILDTDYTSYTVVWGCRNYFFFNRQYLWIMTRDRHPPEAFLEDLHVWLNGRGLSTWFLRRTSQDC